MAARVVLVFLCFFTVSHSITSGDWSPSAGVSSSFHHHDEGAEAYYTTAYINVTFVDPVTGRTVREKTEIGKFGESHIGVSSGIVVHVKSGADNSGCTLPFRSTSGSGELPKESWIALVRRGGCNFQVKVDNAYSSEASGIIVYNDRDSSVLEKMKLTLRPKRRPLGAVFTYKWKGEQLAALADNGTRVMAEVTVAHHCSMRTSINRTSVLFVSISFVVLMLISLAWLVFYYVQRFRYINAKDRLSYRKTRSSYNPQFNIHSDNFSANS